MLTEGELGYTAGIIDGEGCINMKEVFDTQMTKNYYRLRVFVVNTKEELLVWLYKNFGGHINISKSKNKNHNTMYTWIIYGKEAEDFLICIYKYLILKKKQAGVAFSFMNKEWHTSGKEFYTQMKELNKKGGERK